MTKAKKTTTQETATSTLEYGVKWDRVIAQVADYNKPLSWYLEAAIPAWTTDDELIIQVVDVLSLEEIQKSKFTLQNICRQVYGQDTIVRVKDIFEKALNQDTQTVASGAGKACVICGQLFTPVRSTQVLCGQKACRKERMRQNTKAYKRKRKQQQPWEFSKPVQKPNWFQRLLGKVKGVQ